jgi:hypothetical protein
MAACLLAVTTPLYGQIIYGSHSSASIQLQFNSWSITDDNGKIKIEQWVTPVSGFVPIRDNFEARFHISGSSNYLEKTSTSINLKGVGDFRVLLSHSFYDDRLLASFGLNLPTGKKKLDYTSEREIIERLSESYLSFPTRRLGEGFGFNFLLGGATVTGPVKLGAGITYMYSGSYEPYKDLSKYDPGDSYNVNASGDLNIKDITITSNIIYTNYTIDKQNGLKAFKQSPQLDLEFGGLFTTEKYSIRTNAACLLRGRHTRYDIQSGDILNRLKMYGNEFLILARLDYFPSRTWYVAPLVEMKWIAANEEPYEDKLGNSSIFGIGGDFGIRIREGIEAAFGLKYCTGLADSGNMDLSGFQLTSLLLASF